ncbi:MAG: hypothetical protein KF777_20135 [Planctomycetaceae bacterium]|nr:hypothetical protein [Planctomycetaceae bacterium]
MTARPLAVVLLLAWGAWAIGESAAAAQEAPAATVPILTRIAVPQDRPETWPSPETRWEPLPRDEFERLWKLQQSPTSRIAPVWLESVHATAVLTESTLRAGTLTGRMTSSASEPRLFSLSPLNVALSELAWSNGPAVWGAGPKGDILVLVPPGSHEFNARWTAQGRRFGSQVELLLDLPRSAITSLEILADSGRTLMASGSDVVRSEDPREGYSRWRIELGSATSTQIVATDSRGASSRPSLLLYQQDITGLIREEEIRFLCRNEVEVLGDPIGELSFLIAGEAEVFAVTMGTETTLSHELVPGPGRRRKLMVRLPEPMSGRLRPIRIEGVAARRPGAVANAPQVDLAGGVFQGANHAYTIPGPLQMRSLRPVDYRQISAPLVTPAGEQWSFRQEKTSARLVLDVRRPTVAVSVQSLTHVAATGDLWTLSSQLRWNSPNGNVFQLACRVPRGWEVTDVRPASQGSSLDVAAWDLELQADGTQMLTFELQRAITPDRGGGIEILANRRLSESTEPLPLPVFHPEECETADQVVVVDVSENWQQRLEDDSGFEAVTPGSISSQTREAFRWPPESVAGRAWYRGTLDAPPGTLMLATTNASVDLEADLKVQLLDGRLIETWTLTGRGANAPMASLRLNLPRADEFVWSRGHAGPVGVSPDPDEASDVSRFLLTWADKGSGDFVLVGRRERVRGGLMVIPLATSPQANRFEGAVTLSSTSLPDVGIQSIGAMAEVEAKRSTEMDAWSRTWTYQRENCRIELRHPESTDDSRQVPLASVRIRSLLSDRGVGQDLHRAECRVLQGTEGGTFRFSLPETASLLSVVVNGERVVPAKFQSSWAVPGLTGGDRDMVELLYRTNLTSSPRSWKRTIPLPRLTATVVDFEWVFALPPTIRLFEEPRQVWLRDRPEGLNWTQRVFGPLGRGSGGIFNPFSRDSWAELVQQPAAAPASLGDIDAGLKTPVEWQEHRAVAPTMPAEIELATWNLSRLRLLEWCLLLATMIVGILVRMLKIRYRQTVGLTVAAVMFSASLFGQQPAAELCGSILTGLVLSSLLPRRLFAPRPRPQTDDADVPVGSTQSFRLPISQLSGILILLSIGAGWGLAWGQEGAAVSSAGRSAEPRRETVLIPVDSSLRPSDRLQLVYVRPEFARELRKVEADLSGEPIDYLLASSDYRIVGELGQSSLARARLEYHVLTSDSKRPLRLPFVGASLTSARACLIDGRERPVRQATNGGSGWEVDLPPRSADTSMSVTPTIIELEFLIPTREDATGLQLGLQVPRAAACGLTFEIPQPVRGLQVPEARGDVQVSLNGQSITASLGAISDLRVAWQRAGSAERPPAEVTARVLQSALCQWEFTEVQFRIFMRVERGVLPGLSFQIAENAIVRELRGASDLRWRQESSERGPSVVTVDFIVPRTAEFVLEGTYVSPGGGDPRTIPQLVIQSTAGSTIRTELSLIGLAATTGGRVQPATAGEANTAWATDAFLTSWGGSPPQTIPELVLQLRDDAGLRVNLARVEPRRVLSRVDHNVVLEKRRLLWETIADMRLTVGSAYWHSFVVDRRLQIEQISVQEGGAERVFRSAMTRLNSQQDRVVIFLREPASGDHLVRIRGNLPLRAENVTDLPSLRFEDSELVDGRFNLFAMPEVAVNFVPGRTLEPTDDVDPLVVLPADRLLVGRFLLREPDVLGEVTLTSPALPGRAQTVVRVEVSGADSRIHGRTSGPWNASGSPYALVEVPREFRDDEYMFEHARGELLSETEKTRRWRLTPATDDASQPPIVKWTRSEWNGSSESALSRPRFVDVPVDEVFLVLDPGDIATVVGGTAVDPSSLPEFLAGTAPSTTASSTTYRIGDSVTLVWNRGSVSPSPDDGNIHVEHAVWFETEAGLYGRTHIAGLSGKQSIEVAVPPELRVLAVFVDQRAVSPRTDEIGRLTIDGRGEGRATVRIIWSRRRSAYGESGWLTGIETLPMIELVDVPRTESLTLVPPSNWTVWTGAPATRQSWFETVFPVLERAVDELESGEIATPTSDSAANALYGQMVDDLSREIELGHITREELARWNEIVGRLDRMGVRQTPRKDGQSPSLERLAGHPNIWHGVSDVPPGQPLSVRYLLLDGDRLRFLPAALLAVVVFVLGQRLRLIDFGEWIGATPWRPWLLLGLLWWTCLAPSLFGLALVAYALSMKWRGEYGSDRETLVVR